MNQTRPLPRYSSMKSSTSSSSNFLRIRTRCHICLAVGQTYFVLIASLYRHGVCRAARRSPATSRRRSNRRPWLGSRSAPSHAHNICPHVAARQRARMPRSPNRVAGSHRHFGDLCVRPSTVNRLIAPASRLSDNDPNNAFHRQDTEFRQNSSWLRPRVDRARCDR